MNYKIGVEGKSYLAATRCIYCGSTASGRTKEHIIPRGIGGNVVLPAASCDSCQKITSIAEQRCLRRMFGSFRAQVGMGSKKRTDSAPYKTFMPGEAIQTKTAPFAEHLGLLKIPMMIGPELLTGVRANTFDVWAHVGNIEAAKSHPAGTRVGDGSIALEWYGQMLAKICHAFACAELPPGSFDPLLPDLILGRSEDVFSFIGCQYLPPPPPSAATHELSWMHMFAPDRRRYLVVRARLFAVLGAPEHLVVVGGLYP